MNFSFDATAGASQSTVKPRLAGNDIYTVKFDDCEITEFQGVKDTSMTYKVLKFKFSNEDGDHEETIFEPKPEDFKRGENKYIDKKTGKENKIPQASNVESMMLFFKHVIDAFVPEVGKAIDNGSKSLTAADWDGLRNLMVKIMNSAKGRESSIKLIKNNKGEARIPSFFAAVNKDGKSYIKNNFIGNKLAFTPYEITRINNEATAKPTTSDDLNLNVDTKSNNLDLDFDISSL